MIKKKYGNTDSKAPIPEKRKQCEAQSQVVSALRTQVAWDTALRLLEFAHFLPDPHTKLFRQFNRVTM